MMNHDILSAFHVMVGDLSWLNAVGDHALVLASAAELVELALYL
jgi:hypothetical protein